MWKISENVKYLSVETIYIENRCDNIETKHWINIEKNYMSRQDCLVCSFFKFIRIKHSKTVKIAKCVFIKIKWHSTSPMNTRTFNFIEIDNTRWMQFWHMSVCAVNTSNLKLKYEHRFNKSKSDTVGSLLKVVLFKELPPK